MRTDKSIKNIGVMFVTQTITLILEFASRTIFIKNLGAEYLGLNGLFSNILNTLSLAEMGIGAAISYALYKPIAEVDREQIKSILAFYKRCYFNIGIFILIAGIFLIPFLPFLIKDKITVQVDITSVYLCFLLNSVIGYFFAHKRIIIDDSQNKRITAVIDFSSKTAISILQIFILIKFKNYMWFLYAKILGTLIASIVILFFADKKYPYIREKSSILDREKRKKIWNNVSILFFSKLGAIGVLNTDFILISAFIGIAEVGIYSNYTLIINVVSIFVMLFVQGADASIGNAIATLEKDRLYAVFKKISFLIFCISGFSCVCLINLLNPFIEFWIGEEYVFSGFFVFFISLNFFFTQNRWLTLTFKQNAGLFRPDMYKPLIEVAFNLILSILLLKYFGILGIVIGTLCNTFFICIWVEAYIVFKHLFKISVREYVFKYVLFICPLIISCVFCLYINSFLDDFIFKFFITLFFTTLIYFLFFFRTEEFKYFVELFRKMVKK